ncbi:MAG: chorismate mutase [Alphaproteobacteria bacterium]|nr:chorismate mutase [Alphaproteobacteria bacterium]
MSRETRRSGGQQKKEKFARQKIENIINQIKKINSENGEKKFIIVLKDTNLNVLICKQLISKKLFSENHIKIFLLNKNYIENYNAIEALIRNENIIPSDALDTLIAHVNTIFSIRTQINNQDTDIIFSFTNAYIKAKETNQFPPCKYLTYLDPIFINELKKILNHIPVSRSFLRHLNTRFSFIRQIAQLKYASGISVIQRGRKDEVLKKYTATTDKILQQKLKKLYLLIHEKSVQLQHDIITRNK